MCYRDSGDGYTHSIESNCGWFTIAVGGVRRRGWCRWKGIDVIVVTIAATGGGTGLEL